MAETPTTGSAPPPGTAPMHTTPARRPPIQHRSGAWQGWIVFAGLLLTIIGAFQAIEGLVALFQNDYYAVTRNGLVVHWNYTAWGWIMLVLAAANILAGIGVLRAQTWARIWAILVASLSVIANIGFTSAYPIWALMVIALDIVIIYALCVHWDEAT